jgi:hypothetical protein
MVVLGLRSMLCMLYDGDTSRAATLTASKRAYPYMLINLKADRPELTTQLQSMMSRFELQLLSCNCLQA